MHLLSDAVHVCRGRNNQFLTTLSDEIAIRYVSVSAANYAVIVL